MPGGHVRFGILGPVEIWTPDGVRHVERPLRTAALAFLLLRAGQVVSADQLEEALWGGASPATARTQIHTAMSRIRRVLRMAGWPDTLATKPGGYMLTVAEAEVDLAVFDARVKLAHKAAAENRYEVAAEELRRAQQLWRGCALGGASAAFVAAARQRLGDRRLVALEDLADVELAMGRHARLVAELGALVDAHPLRERPTCQLMLALYRNGRRADALAAYHRFRNRLVDELGIEPGRELQGRHEAILRADPALDGDPGPPIAVAGRAPVPRELPGDVFGFIGRDGPLAELDALADKASRGPAVVIAAVSGTAGVGKTALALHWAHRVADRFADGQLYVNLRGFGPAEQMMDPAEAVYGFLEALGVPPQRMPSTLDGRTALYRSLLADKQILIVLDNARNTGQVRPLLPGTPGCLVLVTSRNLLSGLVATDAAQPVTLDLLTEDEARELLAGRLGHDHVDAEPDAVKEIIAHCARLPLALAVVAAQIAAHPRTGPAVYATALRDTHRRWAALTGDDPATDVRAVLSWSYQALSPGAARLFRLLGLHPGPDVGATAVMSLCGATETEVRPLLAELSRAHLMVEQPPGRYVLHDLLRAFAAEQLRADSDEERHTATRRVLDHYVHSAYAAARLINSHADPIPLDPPAPGVHPERHADHMQALHWLNTEHAILLAAVGQSAAGLDNQIWRLAWALGSHLNRRGHWHDWTNVARLGLSAAQRAGEIAAQARAHRSLAIACTNLNRLEDAQTHLRHALDLSHRQGNMVDQAHTRLSMGNVSEQQGHNAEALDHARQALDLYLAARHLQGQADALNSVGWYHALLGDYERAIVYCEQALALHQELGHGIVEATTWDSLGYAHHHLGHHTYAITCYQRAVDLFRDLDARYDQAETLNRLGDTHHAAGDPDAARETWRRALAILTDLNHPDADRVHAKLRAPTAN